eukprot:m.48877 g.48877  ORF g.48877 m.48877 type:complete len:66 (+) comp7420_c1_seq1:1652-1849(+)
MLFVCGAIWKAPTSRDHSVATTLVTILVFALPFWWGFGRAAFVDNRVLVPAAPVRLVLVGGRREL